MGDRGARAVRRPGRGFWAMPAPAVLLVLGPLLGALYGLLVLPVLAMLTSLRTDRPFPDVGPLVSLSLTFALVEVVLGLVAGAVAAGAGVLVRWPFAESGPVGRAVAVSVGSGAAAFLIGWLLAGWFDGYFGAPIATGLACSIAAGCIAALVEWACAAGNRRYARRLQTWSSAVVGRA